MVNGNEFFIMTEKGGPGDKKKYSGKKLLNEKKLNIIKNYLRLGQRKLQILS